MNVTEFMEDHFRHFNARELLAAAKCYRDFVTERRGAMMVTLAGAMSTAELGRSLSDMIREGNVHAITCTAANLEEDLFHLFAKDEYEIVENWRALSAADEQSLLDRGLNRVTDTCIPETVMRHIEGRLLKLWQQAADLPEPKTPAEFLFSLLDQDGISDHFQGDPRCSWLVAAREHDVPVFVPGFEDSTLGNIFTARVMEGVVSSHDAVRSGTYQLQQLAAWYRRTAEHRPIGFFQIGGGIAGDFSICAVPMMRQDLGWDAPLWDYFCQISDAVTSYGGYSGAVPNEKITWEKLSVRTPKFMIQSDATIVAPLLFAYVLGW
ncbi:MAG: deoxyhypusine synthase family protein [Planctomycetota bacterium]